MFFFSVSFVRRLPRQLSPIVYHTGRAMQSRLSTFSAYFSMPHWESG